MFSDHLDVNWVEDLGIERNGVGVINFKKPLPMMWASKGGNTVCLLSKQIDKE